MNGTRLSIGHRLRRRLLTQRDMVFTSRFLHLHKCPDAKPRDDEDTRSERGQSQFQASSPRPLSL